MPTNRRPLRRQRLSTTEPGWITLVRRGEWPEPGSSDDEGLFEWYFLTFPVPGAPDHDSPEGKELWYACTRAAVRKRTGVA